MVGTIIVTMLTYIACRTGSHHGIGQASLLKQTDALLKTVIYCILAGAVFGVIWPYFILFIVRLVNYISSDLGSPFNMILYGITDRFLQLVPLKRIDSTTTMVFAIRWIMDKYCRCYRLWVTQMCGLHS